MGLYAEALGAYARTVAIQEPYYRRMDRVMPLAVHFDTYRILQPASRGFSATARLSCIVLHQRPFKC